ncbi:MAG TPA: cytochrome c-type biogenesis CcmF C-terminal domain-containing protein, partial [Phenylobacterium sp.]
ALRTTPRALVGLTLAHAGLGLVVLGITGVTAWHSDKVLSMRTGDTVAFAGRTLTLSKLETTTGPNYEARTARFTVKGQGAPFELRSERRFYPSAQSQTTEAGIHVRPQGNLYVSVGEESGSGIVVRLWNHPLIVWIWLGGLTMALGGAVSLSDRRLRLGAAVRTAVEPQPAAAE